MKTEMNNRILFIQNAQLRDELSDREKMIASMQFLLDKAESEKESTALQLRQEYDNKLSLLEENHKRSLEQREEELRYQLSAMEAKYRKALLEKEEENQRLRESCGTLSVTYSKSLNDLNSQCKELEKTLEKSEVQKDWHIRKFWSRSSEQARLLQNRAMLTDREKKALYLMNSDMADSHLDACDLDTSRIQRRKSKKPRLDYSKHNPYTDNPHYIKLDDYYKAAKGESLKMRKGEVEKRLKRVLVMVPAHFEEYFVEVATVRCHGEERDSRVIDELVVPGVPFDAETISFLLTEHFCFNTTWSNIVKKLEYYGVHLSKSTLVDMMHRCISYLNSQIQTVWINELYNTHYWMIDETTGLTGVTDKDGKKSYLIKYLWGIRAQKLKLSWFIYDDGSRSRRVIRPFLDKFQGYFTTDGYIAYKMYDNQSDAPQKRCSCLTHIRRPFVESLNENRKIVSWFINKIKKMFSIDSECKELKLSSEARKQVRICRTSVIMQEIEEKFNYYINNGSFSKLGLMTQRALKYIQKEWKAMKNVLKSGDVELSNNLCEQMMRHVKINLKNSLNIGSEQCAKNFCFMYSLVESCGFNELSPIKYLSHLLSSLHSMDVCADKRMLLPCYCKL